VTFNSAAYITRCLDSLADPDQGVSVNVWVVDNASEDDTVGLASTHCVHPIILVNDSNKGFATACNDAIRRSGAGYVLLLNPDAALDPGTLSGMLRHLELNREVGIVGPRFTDECGALHCDQSCTGIFPGFAQSLYEYTRLHRIFPDHYPVRAYFMSAEQRLQNMPVAMVQGACFLFRRELVDDIGELDERYFLYFEETDFCKRAAGRGWEVHYLGRLSTRHKGGHSMTDARQNGLQFIRSMYMFHWKHTGKIKTLTLWSSLMIYHGVKSIKMKRKSTRNPENRTLAQDAATCVTRFKSHFFFLSAGGSQG
jgi:GT2 family glycosyltransferase